MFNCACVSLQDCPHQPPSQHDDVTGAAGIQFSLLAEQHPDSIVEISCTFVSIRLCVDEMMVEMASGLEALSDLICMAHP